MTKDVEFEEAGEIYTTVGKEATYSSEVINLIMKLLSTDSEKKAKTFLMFLCLLLLLISTLFIFKFSGFFRHRIVVDQSVIDEMSKLAPFQSKQI